MLKTKSKIFFALIAVCIFCTCIDPYTPKLGGYSSLLVVDGLITDANHSYTIKISSTFQDQNSIPAGINDATVFITDDKEQTSYLRSMGGGVYKTDSLQFRGVVGRTYVLHITTADGEQFESEPCFMNSVADIDSIYFSKDQKLLNSGTQTQEGISIFLDSKGGDPDQYYRWTFDETWKFKVPNPKKFDFDMEDSSITTAQIKEYCWKNKSSDNILVFSSGLGQSGQIKGEPIFFIASDQSDRLTLQYSIMINQYSISKKEYEFWNNMKQINDRGGDIFSKQPFTVTSNIKNINNPKERILGYFQVSAVKQRRKFISFSEIAKLNLPHYNYPCERIEKEPGDFQTEFGPKITWDYIYALYCVTSKYSFIEPIYSGTNNLSKMVFAKPECAVCDLTGTQKKPAFWVDIN